MWVRGEAGLGKNCIVDNVFLDTNVLAYLFDNNAAEKQQAARRVLESEKRFVISTQVMLELHSVLTRKFAPPLPTPEAGRVLAALERFEVVAADADLVLRAAHTVVEHQLSIWDAMILEAARLARCSEVWTEDLASGSTIRGVKVINPFDAESESR